MKNAILIWVIGFLFTFGYAWSYHKDKELEQLTPRDTLTVFIAWPAFLGAETYSVVKDLRNNQPESLIERSE